VVVHYRTLPLSAGLSDFPSVTAWDSVDGDLTAAILIQVSVSDLSRPTFPTAPVVLRYSVTDSDGNTATAERHVHLLCATGERMCSDDSGMFTCSAEGLCLGLDFSALLSNALGPSTPLRSPPTITLIGDPVVNVPRFSNYTVCSPNTPRGRVCERGVTADDELQGSLIGEVTACSPATSRDLTAFNFATRGVAGCDLDTRRPGIYTIDFRVVNDAGLAASARREVRVEDLCLGGARLCANLQCSEDGVCLDELLGVVSMPAITITNLDSSSAHLTMQLTILGRVVPSMITVRATDESHQLGSTANRWEMMSCVNGI
jgi:hypothetical protein